MSGVKWIITRDYLAEGPPREDGYPIKNMTDTCGPRGCDDRTADQLPDTFRMYDDDGILYYEGKTDALTNPAERVDSGFEPLDDFGGPDAGCTEIQYLNEKGEWETL